MKFSIKNRKGLIIYGDVVIPENPKGLAFVMHGLGGFRDQKPIQLMVSVFLEQGYTVVNFDVTNSIGESEGKYEDATMQLHYEDLEDIVTWAKSQEWYKKPFIVSGHSLGGYAAARYAEEYPSEVKAVFPYALVVSGKMSHEAHERNKREELEEWKKTGWAHRMSNSKPGVEMRLPWSHMEERLNHDLMPKAANLTMPVLFVVGENDSTCPPDHERALFDGIPGKKEFHIVPGAAHTFKQPEHLEELRKIISHWLKNLE